MLGHVTHAFGGNGFVSLSRVESHKVQRQSLID
ncbi:hypothetical protein G1C94_0016 [Bifidobacterium sp. DSM 109963]|uniref:Uncharacterized protein n=1 Tax=Bifidobacterium panos TaxID=2675321 RepID=A0ABX1SUA4_9BIFI|nr:hypothetical protein [Bifidobacterium sp. DSM 109963]